MPKCTHCKKELDKTTAYLVEGVTRTGNPTKKWYCSKEEYDAIQAERNNKAEAYKEILKYFPMIKASRDLPRILFVDMGGIADVHKWEGILRYLQNDQEYLSQVMDKEFPSYDAKAKYLFKVIVNRIDRTNKQEEPRPVIIKQTEDFFMSEPVVQPKKKTTQRRGFDDLLEEL